MSTMAQIAEAPSPGRIPGRTCVTCGRSTSAGELLRLTALPGGALMLDWGRSLGGRGAWVCAARDCIERGLRGRRFDRPLRTKPVYPAVDDLIGGARTAFERRIETLLRSARGGGKLFCGTDAVLKSLGRGSLRMLLVARDAAGMPRLRERAGTAGVPVEVFFDKSRIGGLLGRPDTGVIGISDQGLAKAIGKGLAGLRGLE